MIAAALRKCANQLQLLIFQTPLSQIREPLTIPYPSRNGFQHRHPRLACQAAHDRTQLDVGRFKEPANAVDRKRVTIPYQPRAAAQRTGVRLRTSDIVREAIRGSTSSRYGFTGMRRR